MSDDLFDRFLDEVVKSDKAELDKSVEVADPTVDRLPVVMAIDRSYSTEETGDIRDISSRLQDLARNIADARSVEWERVRAAIDLAVVSYGGDVRVDLDWTQGVHLRQDSVASMVGSGGTPMGAALEKAVKLMIQRLAYYRHHDVRANRGYIFNVTDGNPTDMDPNGEDAQQLDRWGRVKAALDMFETAGSTSNAYAQTYHFASRSANRDLLRTLAYTDDRVVDLHTADFERLFEFVRVSLLAALDEDC